MNTSVLPIPEKIMNRGRFRIPGVVRKIMISAFVILNISAVVHANRPHWLTRRIDSALDSWGGHGAYRVRYAGWLLAHYAHTAGLDNRWVMFSHQPRFQWWFHIKGVDDRGETFDLDVPTQGRRTFLETAFFDFREAKYMLNLYENRELRARYANYLCRNFPFVRGRPTTAVKFILWRQPLRSAQEARASGDHLGSEAYSRVMDDIPCGIPQWPH